MQHLLGAAVAVLIIPGLTVWILWFEPTVEPVMTPLTASPFALYSSFAIYGLFVSMALYTLFRSWRKMRHEHQVTRFLEKHVQDHSANEWFYKTNEDTALASGIFGSKGDTERSKSLTGRIVSLLHADARFFRFEPVHLAMRSEGQLLHAHSARIGSYQTLAVRAGILGTFIGLIMSLSRVQEVFVLRGTELANNPSAASLATELNAVRDRIAGLMGDVVQGLSIAFGTSIAGLIAAFVIYFLAAQARDQERQLADRIHGVCQKVQKFLRDQYNESTELVRTAQELRGVMRENLSALSSTSKDLHENAVHLGETSRALGAGLIEPVQLFASNASTLKQLLEQSTAAAAAAKEVSASLSAAEQGAAKRMDAVAAELVEVSERSNQQVIATIETNSKAAAQTGSAMAAAVTEAMGNLSSELVSGLGQRLGGNLQQEVLSGLVAELGKMHEAHEASIRQIRREGQRQTRNAFALAILLVVCAVAYTFYGDGLAGLLTEAKSSLGLSAPALPGGDDRAL